MPRPSRALACCAALLAAALTLTACGSGGGADATRETLPAQEESAVSAARRAAEEAAGGQRIGGTLNLLGVLSGPQLDAYLSSFAPFEEATGIDLRYEGTRDVNAVLQTRIAGGNPPDLVSNPSAGQMRALAAEGRLVALDDKIDLAAARHDFPGGLLDLATVNGRLYGLFYNSAVNNLVWYDPKHYDGPEPAATLQQLDAYAAELAGQGRTPYCAGLESGAASGWPGAGWVEQLVLTQSGPAAFDRWVQGQLPWTSPEVRQAFQTFGAVVTDPKMVAGGPTAVLTTSFDKSPQGLVARRPACYLHVQADFLGNLLAASVPGVKPVTDIDFYPFPAAAPGQERALDHLGGDARRLPGHPPDPRVHEVRRLARLRADGRGHRAVDRRQQADQAHRVHHAPVAQGGRGLRRRHHGPLHRPELDAAGRQPGVPQGGAGLRQGPRQP